MKRSLSYFLFSMLVIVGLFSCNTTSAPPKSPQATSIPPKIVKNTIIGNYIDHGNGTVTDTKTHLMWKKCTEGHKGINCSGYFHIGDHIEKAYEKGYYGDREWIRADKPCHKYSPNGHCQFDNSEWVLYSWERTASESKNHHFAGYKDWRLPTTKELSSLRECQPNPNREGTYIAPTIINRTVFPRTYVGRYWVSNSIADAQGGLPLRGYVDFSFLCEKNSSNPGNLQAVRLVRSIKK